MCGVRPQDTTALLALCLCVIAMHLRRTRYVQRYTLSFVLSVSQGTTRQDRDIEDSFLTGLRLRLHPRPCLPWEHVWVSCPSHRTHSTKKMVKILCKIADQT
jgi:hypothetical protein